MKPIQIFIPRLGGSIRYPSVARDAARAQQSWQGELVVWMFPEISKVRRWRTAGIGQVAVHSESFERVDLVHVNEAGEIFAPTIEGLPSSIDGLLHIWLNSRFEPYPAIESLTVETPDIDEGTRTIGTKERTVAFGPGAYLPISSVDPVQHTVTMSWPPEGSPASVSPETESAERFPSRKVESDPPTIVTQQGDVAPRAFLSWPAPLSSMMSMLSGPDDIQAQAEMVRLARLSGSDMAAALNTALVKSQPYLSRGHSTAEHTWFQPTLKRLGLKAVLFKAEDKGLTVPSELRDRWDETALDEALKQEAWQQWLSEPVPVRRAWGGVGLFWTLLIDCLEAYQSFATCQRCGRVISAKAGKRFCGPNDPSDCFKARRAFDQRRSRSGKVKRQKRSSPRGSLSF